MKNSDDKCFSNDFRPGDPVYVYGSRDTLISAKVVGKTEHAWIVSISGKEFRISDLEIFSRESEVTVEN